MYLCDFSKWKKNGVGFSCVNPWELKFDNISHEEQDKAKKIIVTPWNERKSENEIYWLLTPHSWKGCVGNVIRNDSEREFAESWSKSDWFCYVHLSHE